MQTLTLEQRRAIDRAKEGLVKAAEAMLEATKAHEIGTNDFGDSQLRNLIAIANETESPAVVANFIRYQVGRDFRRKGWGYVVDGKSLGQRLIDEIDTKAVAGALETIPDLESSELQQLARIHLVRHFLGFASRYLKYVNLQRGRRS